MAHSAANQFQVQQVREEPDEIETIKQSETKCEQLKKIYKTEPKIIFSIKNIK